VRTERSTLEMIAACFRHQHPEDFGRELVSGVNLPPEVCYQRDEVGRARLAAAIQEEAMGDPGATSLLDDDEGGFASQGRG